MRFFRPRIGAREPAEGLILPAFAGGVTGLTMLVPACAPLQIVAFAALGLSLRRATGPFGRMRPGFWFGSTMAATVLMVTGVPAGVALVLFGALSAYWTALGTALSFQLARGGLGGWVGAAALVTLGEFAQVVALPLFGTAQRFSGAWVNTDATLLLSRCGGTLAVSAFVAAVAFAWVLRAGLSRRAGLTIALGSGLVVGAGWMPGAAGRGGRELTVAACGEPAGGCRDVDSFLAFYGPMVESAARAGARVVVTPELALYLTSRERDAALARIAREANRFGVCWVAGFSQYGPKANRVAILNADAPAYYDKTHWVPGIESYAVRGDGLPVVAELRPGPDSGVRVGVMICQDDNFEDVARGLSLARADIVAVPTLDWRGVEQAHLNSARNRPREFGYVAVRAAIGGVSAIIDPQGRVLAARNHLAEGAGWVAATVALPGVAPTPYARTGPYALPALAALAWPAAGARRGRSCESMAK